MKRFFFFALAIVATGTLFAQIPGHDIPPRRDDHFQRKLVVNRIDLNEKVNLPIVATQSPALYGSPEYAETNGLIVALFNGLQSGKYLAYDPDSLNKSLTYEDVMAQCQRINGEVDSGWDEFPEDEGPWDPESDLMIDEETGEGDVDIFFTDGEEAVGESFDYSPYESVVEFIEGRIFDKNRSSEVHDLQYVRLVWVDPGETLPDQNVVCFRYADLLDVLEETQWTNRHNDAEHRNMREVFENRLFHGFITDISGDGIRTLAESDFRRNQLLEFEHHLWSF